ncbi:putative PTH11-typeG-protein-coupled receptor [Hypoxylon sp. EC38]|nr:putative PTH11-typeG-protein-coupled receptor [Hypoxylon sp. EC38]
MSHHTGSNSSSEDPWYHETNAQTIYVPAAVFLAFCPIIVGTRIWARVGGGGKLGPDDYTILVSLCFALASGGIMLAACHYGYGRHLATISPSDKYQAFKYFYLCQVTYKTCINLTKASILLLYLRLFGNTKWLRWACHFMLTCVIMYCIASVTATIFQCIPVTKAFDKSIKGTCIDNGKFWYANSGFSIATDVIILTIPMPLVYALQIPRVQKAALMMVFALGVFVVITSCLRVTTIDIQATTPDPTYDIASTMWTIIEMNVAIVCACLPQIRPLIVKWFPKLMPSYYANFREHSDQRATYIGSDFSNSYLRNNSKNYSKSEEGKWTRIGSGRARQDGASLPNSRKGDSSSEEYALQDDKGLQIHKTVQYTVEYSPDGKVKPRPSLMA